ncbi:MAG TPA: hypothetical protein VNO35_25255 [Steroidobacteraceae bacterium]|nr:hypothetical protein [Steroidobacteraceae bacterium]
MSENAAIYGTSAAFAFPSAGIPRYGTPHQHGWLYLIVGPQAAAFTSLQPDLSEEFAQRQPGFECDLWVSTVEPQGNLSAV